jgi:hypothetical protein
VALVALLSPAADARVPAALSESQQVSGVHPVPTRLGLDWFGFEAGRALESQALPPSDGPQLQPGLPVSWPQTSFCQGTGHGKARQTDVWAAPWVQPLTCCCLGSSFP